MKYLLALNKIGKGKKVPGDFAEGRRGEIDIWESYIYNRQDHVPTGINVLKRELR